MNKYATVLLLIFTISFANGQNKIDFEHTVLNHSQKEVFCITKDKTGYMWFALKGELIKFDGYEYTSYAPTDSIHNHFSVPWTLYVDSDNFLWLGTREGLFKFDPFADKLEFVSLSSINEEKKKLAITGFYEDSQKNLQVAVYGKGIITLDRQSYTIRNLIDADHLPSTFIWTLYGEPSDEGDVLWIGSNQGLDRIIINNKAELVQSEHFKFGIISSIFRDTAKKLWIGCYRKGLHSFNEKTNEFTDYNFLPGTKLKSGNYIVNIVEDINGNLWFKDQNEGLYLYNRRTKESRQFIYDPTNSKSISSNSGKALFTDNTGIIWVSAKGIDKINLNKYKFKHYSAEATTKPRLSDNEVTDIFPENDSLVWVATRGGGLNKLNIKTENITYINSENSNLICDSVSCVMKHSSGSLWVGTWGKGLAVLPKKGKGPFKHYQHKADTKSIGSNYISGLFEDSDHNLWVATDKSLSKYNPAEDNFTSYEINGVNFIEPLYTMIHFYEDSHNQIWAYNMNGVSRYDSKNDSMFFYPKDEEQKKDIYPASYFVCEDQNNIVWVATYGGLSRYDREKDKFNLFLQDTAVWSIYEDRQNRLWVCTQNYGLCLFDQQTGKSKVVFSNKRYLTSDFFIFHDDEEGNLWISNHIGHIIQYNPDNDEYKVFDHTDGLSDVYFKVPYQVLNHKDQRHFFWTIGLDGFNIIDLEKIKLNPLPPEVSITNLWLFNESVTPSEGSIIDKHINYVDTLILRHNQNYLTFEFAALDYSSPEKNKYKYMLEGFDKDWIFTDASFRKVNYTNIKPGEYVLRVLSTNNDGIWNEEGKKLTVIIKPPFWERLWFKVSALIFLLACIYVFIKIRERKLIKQKKNLEGVVKLRNREVLNMNEELKIQFEKINDQKEKIEVQHKSITDSISYAKRIQSAALISKDYIDEMFHDNFILFKPKDKVSGDFYWFKQTGKYKIAVAADCTGHGVPGALLSMLGIAFLTDIIQNPEITRADHILNDLRKRIQISLGQTGKSEEAGDGMDISLCVLDTSTNVMQFAGANNPLYIFQNDNFIEVKADRMPIGYYPLEEGSFSNKEIQLNKGDVFYIFSDGYQDQYGGKDNSKFSVSKFKDLLAEIHSKPMKNQRDILEAELQDWMGSPDQTDDILIVGIRI